MSGDSYFLCILASQVILSICRFCEVLLPTVCRNDNQTTWRSFDSYKCLTIHNPSSFHLPHSQEKDNEVFSPGHLSSVHHPYFRARYKVRHKIYIKQCKCGILTKISCVILNYKRLCPCVCLCVCVTPFCVITQLSHWLSELNI